MPYIKSQIWQTSYKHSLGEEGDLCPSGPCELWEDEKDEAGRLRAPLPLSGE